MIGLIWAQTTAGVIGADNTIPWRLPEDTAHFKTLTTGHPVIMGRRTWDSLPPRFRPLPGRRNIVVTGQGGWRAAGAETAHSLDDALEQAGGEDIWVMGGAQIYRAAMPFATDLAVTEIDTDVGGDVYAPAVNAEWTCADATEWRTSISGLRYRFVRYVRVRS